MIREANELMSAIDEEAKQSLGEAVEDTTV